MTTQFTTFTASPTSVAAACHDVRRMLSQNLNDELVFTASDYTPGSNTLAVKAVPKRCGPGSVLSAGDVTLYVVSASGTSANFEVLAGYDGGPDAAIPAGTPLRLNPRFTDFTIFNAVVSAVASMASPANSLHGVQVDEVGGYNRDGYYPIPAAYASTVLKVLKVMARSAGANDWVRLGPGDFAVSLTPGGQHVRVFIPADRLEISYATQITRPKAFADDLIADCGLTDTMIDIPAYGAASVLMYGQEARRVNQRAQGDPRRAEDVPMTGATGAARDLRRMFEQRIDEEYTRLAALYPYRVA